MKKAILVSSALGLIVGGAMMSIAWEHNPQCEIHCDNAINWGYWLLIGASWFIPTFLIVFLIPSVFCLIKKKIRKRGGIQ